MAGGGGAHHLVITDDLSRGGGVGVGAAAGFDDHVGLRSPWKREKAQAGARRGRQLGQDVAPDPRLVEAGEACSACTWLND